MGSPPRDEKSAHSRFLTEEFPDGFRDDIPQWSAFCPDRRAKRTLAEHEECGNFAGATTDADGNVIAFRCSLREDSASRKAASRRAARRRDLD
jgi:hypothetical protein